MTWPLLRSLSFLPRLSWLESLLRFVWTTGATPVNSQAIFRRNSVKVKQKYIRNLNAALRERFQASMSITLVRKKPKFVSVLHILSTN